MQKLELKPTSAGYELIIDDRVKSVLLSIPAGPYEREDGKSVKVNSFCMGQFPVTQELYEAVTGYNPSFFKGSQHPVSVCLPKLSGNMPPAEIDPGKGGRGHNESGIR